MDLNALKNLINDKKKELVKNEKPYTAKIGDNRIVLLPGWSKPEIFWREFGSHFIKDSSGKTVGFYPCDDVIFHKPCPVCSALAEVARSTSDEAVLDLVKKARANTQFLVNVIVVGEFNNQPQVMSLSKTAFEQLLNLIGSWGAKVFDPVNPQIISITRTGTGFDTKYMVSVAPDAFPLPEGIMSRVKNLDEYVNQRTDSMVNKCLQAVNAIGGGALAITAPATAKPTQIAYEDLPTTGIEVQATPVQMVQTQPMQNPMHAPPLQPVQQAHVQPVQSAPAINDELESMLSSIM